MARGKYGTSAEIRKEIGTHEREIANYQNRLAAQQKEILDLRDSLRTMKEANNEQVRKLNAQIAEGTSAELAASKMLIREAQERAVSIKRQAEADATRHTNSLRLLVDAHVAATGLPHHEVMGILIADPAAAKTWQKQQTAAAQTVLTGR